MPLARDPSLDLLASGPARYHCTTDASLLALDQYIGEVIVELFTAVLVMKVNWPVDPIIYYGVDVNNGVKRLNGLTPGRVWHYSFAMSYNLCLEQI